MSADVCGVDSCPAFAVEADGFCWVHSGAKRAGHVMTGTKCPACHRVIVTGDWITRESTLVEMKHAICPPRRPSLGLKVDRAKPLLEL